MTPGQVGQKADLFYCSRQPPATKTTMNFQVNTAHRRRLNYLYGTLLALLVAWGLSLCTGKRTPDAMQEMTMKPSITYLHLLRHTPFFTALSTEQLQWVIDHSMEWAAEPGAVIAKADQQATSAADYWILLDGAWQVEHDGQVYPSQHADPGKWFSIREAKGRKCALVTTENSYVMRITEADMQTMLERGFGFGQRLHDGKKYYDALFPGQAHAR